MPLQTIRRDTPFMQVLKVHVTIKEAAISNQNTQQSSDSSQSAQITPSRPTLSSCKNTRSTGIQPDRPQKANRAAPSAAESHYGAACVT